MKQMSAEKDSCNDCTERVENCSPSQLEWSAY